MDLVPAGGVESNRVLRIGEVEIVTAGAHEDDAIGAADFLKPEYFAIEFFRAVQILDRDGEVQNPFGLQHGCPIRAADLMEHDLFGKPVSTFPDHAVSGARSRPLASVAARMTIARIGGGYAAVARAPSPRTAGWLSRLLPPPEESVSILTSLFQARSAKPSGRGMLCRQMASFLTS